MKSIKTMLAVLIILSSYECYCQSLPRYDHAAELARHLEPSRRVTYKITGSEILQLHLFEPDNYRPTDRRLCFIAIHGGGWTGGAPRRFYPIVKEFVDKGMVGISLEYRLVSPGSGNTVFDCVKDGRTAVRYIRQHAGELGVDPDRIIVCGGSAGAHVAAGTALFDDINESTDDLSVSPVPDALLLYYPVIDASPEGYGSGTIGPRWKELSPLHQVKRGMPPTILFHGTGDTVTPFKGAAAFREAMEKAGNRCDLMVNEGGIHGYMMFDRSLYEQAMQQTVSFLQSLKFLK